MRAVNYIAETYSEFSFFWRNATRSQRWAVRIIVGAVVFCLITSGVPTN